VKRAAAIAAVMLALGATILPARPTSASAAAATEPAITLVAQDAWDVGGGTLNLQVNVPAQLVGPDTTLSLVAYQPVASRAAFDRVIAGEVPTSVLDQVVLPLSFLPTDATGTRTIAVGLEASGAARDPSRLSLRRTGVYPLSVDLRGADERSQSKFTTMAVVVGAAPDGSGAPQVLPSRLGVGWVWPLVTGPSTLPDGTDDPQVSAELRPKGRLGRQAAALTRAGDVPLTLVPGPETLEAWVEQGRKDAAIGRGAAAVRDASGRAESVTSTFVPTDVPSLLAAGLPTAVDSQIVRGDDTLTRLLGTRPDTRTALARPIDGASLARLRAGGVDRVIVDDASIAPDDARTSFTRPFALQPPAALAPSSPVTAVANDTGIAQLLSADGAPALQAQLALAALSVVAQEASDSPRAVVVVNPPALDVSSSLLDAMLTGLRGNPLLQPETVDEIFATVPAESGAARELVAYPPPAPPVAPAAYLAAQERLAAFRSLAGANDPIAVAGNRSLLLSVSATFAGPAGQARAQATLQSIDLSIDQFLSQIHVPRRSTITLTSRSGEIPLTFRNDTGQRVDVVIELASPKLVFPQGSSRLVTLKPKSTTVRFAVESRTSGTFPLQLKVRSSDGGLLVADTQFRVRSTVVSTVGIVLIAGAAVFLALWWALHIRRARRARRAEVAVA
jgi:Family of unknown function (DUF6049)